MGKLNHSSERKWVSMYQCSGNKHHKEDTQSDYIWYGAYNQRMGIIHYISMLIDLLMFALFKLDLESMYLNSLIFVITYQICKLYCNCFKMRFRKLAIFFMC